MLVDSHCHLDHLDLSGREGGVASVVDAAKSRGVEKLLTVAVDAASSQNLKTLAQPFDNVFTSVGVHPSQREPHPLLSMQQLIDLADHPKVIAIGETGLDNYHSQDDVEWQEQSFINHLQAAKQIQKPVIVHTRSARERTIDILRKHACRDAVGVLHCFTESWEMAKQALDIGYYISLSGIVTFKSANELREVAKQVPLDRILVETDSPYLAPVPYRGKQNEPQYVREVCEFIAELRGLSYQDFANITGENFHRLFQLQYH